MNESISHIDQFRTQVRELFRSEAVYSRVIKVAKRDHVYTCGDQDEMIYYLDKGQVKVMLLSPEGKECLLAIHTSGDIFGELCLYGQPTRLETAVTMQDAVIRKMPCRNFLAFLKRESLLEGMVKYLAARIEEQQQVIRTMVTVNSEQRLAITLLRLARRLGRGDSDSVCIEQRISHEELSEMVGTTRPRVCLFLKKLRELGFVELNENRHFVVKERDLKEYLAGMVMSERASTGGIRALDLSLMKSDSPEPLKPRLSRSAAVIRRPSPMIEEEHPS